MGNFWPRPRGIDVLVARLSCVAGDVVELPDGRFLISGQVILSLPDGPCLRCCHLITNERLQREAERYGAAGHRPQVVWPLAVLASTAVAHTLRLRELPAHHRDPFDRLLVAQGLVEHLTIVTHDRLIAAYAVPCLWT